MGTVGREKHVNMLGEEHMKEYDEKRKDTGFFFDLYKDVCTDMTKEEEDQVAAIKDDPKALFTFTYNLACYKEKLKIEEKYPGKDAAESRKMKDAGNKAYQEGQDLQALCCYTQALIFAPVNKDGRSKEFSICLANRSAVLFSLKWYKQATDDIQLALVSGYPDELAYKLYERQGKVRAFFKDVDGACESYKLALKYIEVAKKLKDDKKKQIQQEFLKSLKFFQDTPKSVRDDIKKALKSSSVPRLEVKERNPLYPAMSSAVSFKYEAGRGRYASATRDIKVGETILVENPIVSHPLPEYMVQNCAACFKTLQAPIPCTTCTRALFCSLQCRDKALTSHHKYECKLADFFLSAGMSGICLVAYQLVAQKSAQWFRDNRDMFKDHDERSGETKQRHDKYMSDDYRNLFNLVTHEKKMGLAELFHRSAFSVLLLRCLESQDYFGDDSSDEDKIFIGTLLTHFLQILQFNAHEVAQFEMRGKKFEDGSKSQYIGVAIYPTLALFNHSCEPSVIRTYSGDTIHVQTIKKIRKGEEIYENYGPIFFTSPLASRQDRLSKQYWFKCTCKACNDNWPQLENMGGEEFNFRCPTCYDAVPCSASANSMQVKCSCGTSINILKNLKELADNGVMAEEANTYLEQQNIVKAQDVFINYLDKLDDLIAPPYQDYYKIQQNIWKISWMRYGNKIFTSQTMSAKPVEEVDLD